MVHSAATLGDDAFQADDVGVVELAHGAGFCQEGAFLLVRAACAEGLDGHRQLPLAGELQAAPADFPELTWAAGRQELPSACRHVLVPAMAPMHCTPEGWGRIAPLLVIGQEKRRCSYSRLDLGLSQPSTSPGKPGCNV